MPDYEIDSNGNTFWSIDGRSHREDGPAIVYFDGSEAWYLNGKLHRDGGPAYVTVSGTNGWFSHGKRHRTDGPAYRNISGEEFWAIDSYILDSDQVNNWVKENGFTIPFDDPTQMLFLMKFG